MRLAVPTRWRSRRCRVMEQTGAPLNLRTAPNGQILGNLPNGVLVAIVRDQAVDAKGRLGLHQVAERRGYPRVGVPRIHRVFMKPPPNF